MIVAIAHKEGRSVLTNAPIHIGQEITPIGRGAWAHLDEVAKALVATGKTQPTIVDTTAKAA